jgi:hypothetical protein
MTKNYVNVTPTIRYLIEDDYNAGPPCQDDPTRYLVVKLTRYLVVKLTRYFAVEVEDYHLDMAGAGDLARNPDPNRWAFPLYIYVHGGVALSLTPFADRWDSAQCGYVVVEADDRETARSMASALVDTWNAFLSGDVYRYQVERVTTCNLGHEHAEVLGSCGGFYSEDSAREEAEAVARRYAQEAQDPDGDSMAYMQRD